MTKDGISMGILYVALIDVKDLDENMSIMKKQLEDKKKNQMRCSELKILYLK